MNEPLLNIVGCSGKTQCDAIDNLPVAYLELDAQGVITYANRVAEGMHDMAFGALVGQSVWELLLPDERDSAHLAFALMIDSGQIPGPIRRTLYDRAGVYRTYEIHRNFIHEDDGKPCGVRLVAFDVTAAQHAHEEAHTARMWMESVLESVGDAVVVVDALGFVRYVNPAMVELSGYTSDDLIGAVLDKKLPIVEYTSSDGLPINHHAALEKRCRGVATVLDRDRNHLPIELSTAPVLDTENGYTTGIVCILRRLRAAHTSVAA